MAMRVVRLDARISSTGIRAASCDAGGEEVGPPWLSAGIRSAPLLPSARLSEAPVVEVEMLAQARRDGSGADRRRFFIVRCDALDRANQATSGGSLTGQRAILKHDSSSPPCVSSSEALGAAGCRSVACGRRPAVDQCRLRNRYPSPDRRRQHDVRQPETKPASRRRRRCGRQTQRDERHIARGESAARAAFEWAVLDSRTQPDPPTSPLDRSDLQAGCCPRPGQTTLS
jgi:hypothetical protein